MIFARKTLGEVCHSCFSRKTLATPFLQFYSHKLFYKVFEGEGRIVRVVVNRETRDHGKVIEKDCASKRVMNIQRDSTLRLWINLSSGMAGVSNKSRSSLRPRRLTDKS